MNASALVLIHAATTWYLVGLIWTVQVVHYRLFDRVGDQQFVRYERDHNRLITWVVGPPMLLEFGTAIACLVWPPAGLPLWPFWLGLALLILIWLSTFFVQVPCHTRLLNKFDRATYERLLWTNWIRTGLWTARGVLASLCVWKLVAMVGENTSQ